MSLHHQHVKKQKNFETNKSSNKRITYWQPFWKKGYCIVHPKAEHIVTKASHKKVPKHFSSLKHVKQRENTEDRDGIFSGFMKSAENGKSLAQKFHSIQKN